MCDENTDFTTVDDFNIIYPFNFGVVIYGLENCDRCDILKEMLNKINVEYNYILCDEYISNEIDKLKFKKIMFNLIKAPIPKDGKIQFPVCFINGEYISWTKMICSLKLT
jgi:glutaredoxin